MVEVDCQTLEAEFVEGWAAECHPKQSDYLTSTVHRDRKETEKVLGDRIQHDDWKKEKHVPVIECPDKVKADELFEVKVAVGKEIAHPNTTEHHIRWIYLYFHPEGEKFTYDVGRLEFSAHGEAAAGPNQGPVYTHHQGAASMKISKAGTLHALSFCNIHGLWESAKEIGLL